MASNLVSLQASLVGSTGRVVVVGSVGPSTVVVSLGSVVGPMGGMGDGPGPVLLPESQKNKKVI